MIQRGLLNLAWDDDFPPFDWFNDFKDTRFYLRSLVMNRETEELTRRKAMLVLERLIWHAARHAAQGVQMVHDFR